MGNKEITHSAMHYRKVCNHPFLFGEPKDPKSGQYIAEENKRVLVLASGKFKLLDRMLPRLKKGGHKVLLSVGRSSFVCFFVCFCCFHGGYPPLSDWGGTTDVIFLTDPRYCWSIVIVLLVPIFFFVFYRSSFSSFISR